LIWPSSAGTTSYTDSATRTASCKSQILLVILRIQKRGIYRKSTSLVSRTHRFPGHDYRNPAPGLFKPLRVPPVKDPNNPTPDDDDDDIIEVEVGSYPPA
jgi:hypothetical protein